jgi:hypothetical protein
MHEREAGGYQHPWVLNDSEGLAATFFTECPQKHRNILTLCKCLDPQPFVLLAAWMLCATGSLQWSQPQLGFGTRAALSPDPGVLLIVENYRACLEPAVLLQWGWEFWRKVGVLILQFCAEGLNEIRVTKFVLGCYQSLKQFC